MADQTLPGPTEPDPDQIYEDPMDEPREPGTQSAANLMTEFDDAEARSAEQHAEWPRLDEDLLGGAS